MAWNDNDINALIEGCRATQHKCYVEFSPILYTAIFKICGNKEVASDLLHDSFIDIFRYISSFNSHTNFVAWVKRIAMNNTFNYIKRQKISLKLVEQINTEHEEQFIEPNSTQLDKLLNRLVPEQRMIVWMSVVEQYTHKEIANITGKSESYSKSIVSRSLSKLRTSTEVNLYVAN
ncbi:MAG: RNA polymerase sigma factor [Psychrobium sp.]